MTYMHYNNDIVLYHIVPHEPVISFMCVLSLNSFAFLAPESLHGVEHNDTHSKAI